MAIAITMLGMRRKILLKPIFIVPYFAKLTSETSKVKLLRRWIRARLSLLRREKDDSSEKSGFEQRRLNNACISLYQGPSGLHWGFSTGSSAHCAHPAVYVRCVTVEWTHNWSRVKERHLFGESIDLRLHGQVLAHTWHYTDVFSKGMQYLRTANAIFSIIRSSHYRMN